MFYSKEIQIWIKRFHNFYYKVFKISISRSRNDYFVITCLMIRFTFFPFRNWFFQYLKKNLTRALSRLLDGGEIHSFIKTRCPMYKFWLTLHHLLCSFSSWHRECRLFDMKMSFFFFFPSWLVSYVYIH